MKICAVIAEYNPFHRGHALQTEYIKSTLPDAVILAIMSGNAVQRGELAILDKYTRAEIAVKCGVDAVIELPYPWCASSAGYFARGGLDIAKSVGADYLCFGSESGDIEELKRVAENLSSKEYKKLLDSLISSNPEGQYIPLTRQAYRSLYNSDIPEGANNTLAIEYLKNIGKIMPITHKRTDPSSATAARELYRRGDMEGLCAAVPQKAFEIYKNNSPTDPEAIADILLWTLRTKSAEELCAYADIDMGLASRMVSCANKVTNISDFFGSCATKKYTDSRIRRGALNILCQTTKEQLETTPVFTTLLAANERGRRAIRQIKRQGNITVITKPADHGEVSEQFLFSHRCDKLFAAATGKSPADILKSSPFVI